MKIDHCIDFIELDDWIEIFEWKFILKKKKKI